ncbi:MAG TPA: transglutaminase family protein [Verrucomicrobiae bacterium]
MAVLLMGMPEVGVQESSMRRQNRTVRIWLAIGLMAFAGFSSHVEAQQRVVPRKDTAKKAPVKATAPAKAESKTGDKKTTDSRVESGAMSVEELTERAKKSLVVISHYGRDGKVDGVGSGFVIDAKGLIATSFHVIGEARPIKVAFPDGKQRTVTEVYAWDRKMDLAILKVEAEGLTPLPLGDSDALKQGASVVALGNPQGLEYSVVQGVVSGRREFEYSEMIQLAIPLEPGNSGGPLLDMFGNVHGVLTLKHAVTRNLGFAMPVNALKPLLERPNPVPLGRWLTIATVNTEEWEPFFGARWVQKGGLLSVEGAGAGFGGRSILLSKAAVPEEKFEVAVKVKMDDESGAAGLIFGGENENEHFGFYPSNGRLRLTRFNGPSVYSWQVLRDLPSQYYVAGDWNELRVKVEGKVIKCFVNGQPFTTVPWEAPVTGKVGLAKFRQTVGEFKQFQVGQELPAGVASEATLAKVEEQLKGMKASTLPDSKLVEALQLHGEEGRKILTERAETVKKEAEQLKRLAAAVHERNVQEQLTKLFADGEAKADLFEAAMLVAKLDNEELEVTPYRKQLDRMAREMRERLTEKATAKERIKLLNDYLFAENGFRGSRSDYENKANSYLSNVIDDREGIPITLSVLYLELAKRIGVEDMVGIGLPTHFVVQHRPKEGQAQFIDVFEGGKPMSQLEAELIVRFNERGRSQEEAFEPMTKRQIVVRMLSNLLNSSLDKDTPAESVRYLDTMVALMPEDAGMRLRRAGMRLQMGDTQGSRGDLRWLLDNEPKGVDLDKVAELYRSL